MNAFHYWYDASAFNALKLVKFQDALNYYDKYPSFKENFTKAISSIPQTKVRTAMVKLAKVSGTRFPTTSDFFDYLAAEGGTLTFSEAASAAAEGVGDASKLLFGIGANALLLYAGIAAFSVFILPQLLKKAPAN